MNDNELVFVALVDHPQVMLPIVFYNLAQYLFASIVDVALFKSK